MLVQVKCLLVDDLAENLLALSALLRSDGVEILQARSGAEALELLLVHDVALAFLDVQMPDMDGFELAELMRGTERTCHVPIIFVTAGVRDQHRIFKGYELGAVDFLYKPIDPHILRNKAAVFFQLFQQKQQLAQDLEQRTQALHLNEMFMAVLGHDLRNPLASVVYAADLIGRTSEQESVRLLSRRALTSARRMRQMVDDLLDVARIRLGDGLSVKRQFIDLSTLVASVAEEQQVLRPDRPIVVQATGDVNGNWDPLRLSQVAANLINNALQHGSPDSPIRVLVDGQNFGEVSLSVSNRGSIAPDILAHVFEPFRSGPHKQDNHEEGLGLGLFIVKQIVEAHHGAVAVRSSGDETVFHARVPRQV
ncbi:MAG: hybrid sensor histidine kinase/response regulator [Tahibacter sp.]